MGDAMKDLRHFRNYLTPNGIVLVLVFIGALALAFLLGFHGR